MQLANTAQGFATTPRESRGLNEPLGDAGMINNRNPWCLAVAGTGVVTLAIGLLIFHPRPAEAQGSAPKYEVDPFWPRPLPNQWVTGSVGGVCTDAQDHVFIVNRRNLTDNELDAAYQAPWVIEFDPEGDVVNSWGDANVLGSGRHACYVDYENNVWLPSNQDGIVQKYSHDGSKLLLQIGARGIIDSSDGTVAGRALNSSHTGFYRPGGIAVDRGGGDVYVSDGEEPGSNHRVAVFDRNGRFLRQWVLHRTKAEMEAGEGDEFMQVPHCVAIGNDGLVYVCDRRGDRVQVFDKMGTFQKDILIPYETQSSHRANYGERTQPPGPGYLPRAWGTAGWVGFSPDQAQRFMFVLNEENEQVDIFDHTTGKILSSFGRPGHQAGEFSHGHTMAVDSKGNIFVAEVGVGNEAGHRVQKFRIVASR
jgi:DNA-binding beta-propeller fold protein YncE